MVENLSTKHDIHSIFDLGCGAGANLYLLKKDGFVIGGMDYSENLIKIMHKVLIHEEMIECINDEAINLPVNIKYDSVISNSVFSYFPNYSYAEKVLEKVLQKAKYSVGLIDIHDKNKQEEFLSYRRAMITDYDKHYEGLNKLFYTKEFFSNFAKNHNYDVRFVGSCVDGYWNNDFVFNCYIYK